MTGATRAELEQALTTDEAPASTPRRVRVTVAWGILSTARINRLVLAGAAESDRVRMIAVASRDLGRAESYAREHGLERAYGRYDALLEDPDVEAVYISLPNALHVAWTLRALEAGKHVLCEKPFSRRPDDVEQAFDLAESAGLVLSEGSCGATTRRREACSARRRGRRSDACGSSARRSASSSPRYTAPTTRAFAPSSTAAR